MKMKLFYLKMEKAFYGAGCKISLCVGILRGRKIDFKFFMPCPNY